MTTDAAPIVLEHGHEHDENSDHTHDASPSFTPQPVPMGIAAGLVPMEDGTDRVMVTYTSVNGSWTVFYDREGAIAHAQTLLGIAYQPPVASSTVPDSAPVIDVVAE